MMSNPLRNFKWTDLRLPRFMAVSRGILPFSFSTRSQPPPVLHYEQTVREGLAGLCIKAFRGDYFEQIDTLTYVEKKYDIDLDKRWESAGAYTRFHFGST
jgi:hypothetical protein